MLNDGNDRSKQMHRNTNMTSLMVVVVSTFALSFVASVLRGRSMCRGTQTRQANRKGVMGYR